MKNKKLITSLYTYITFVYTITMSYLEVVIDTINDEFIGRLKNYVTSNSLTFTHEDNLTFKIYGSYTYLLREFAKSIGEYCSVNEVVCTIDLLTADRLYPVMR